MSDTKRYILTVIMVILFVIALVFSVIAIRRNKSERAATITARIRERRKYLPKLQQAIIDYTNQMENLAQDKKLYELKRYRAGMRKNPSLRLSLLWLDNHIYKRIQLEDEQLPKIRQTLDSCSTKVKDKMVRNFALGMPKYCHHAYSYVVYTRLAGAQWETLPLVVRVWYFCGRKMQEQFRRRQFKVNERIKELLEGEPDE
jgi:hypothetical protein